LGPVWFYEGFAVVAGAYAHDAAALRFLAGRIPLPELVARAGDAGFEPWVADRLARAAPS
jgi:hypothetical protein